MSAVLKNLLFIFGFTNISGISGLNVDLDNECQPQKKTSVKGGGVVLIGPIPIVFGSNWKIIVIMTLLAIIIIITTFFAVKFL